MNKRGKRDKTFTGKIIIRTLFSVAMTAKHSIFTTEVLRRVANETDRNKPLLNNLDHAVAENECVGVLYLSLGAAARNTFTDKYPTVKVAENPLEDNNDKLQRNFRHKTEQNPDCFRFLSRTQVQAKSLEQFWFSLNVLAAECDFGTRTESLVQDIFILNKKTLEVQEEICTEPKATPQKALPLGKAFEERTIC